MKTRIEHKIHAIADVLFRDMKDGKLDNEGVGLLAGQTGIIIFCKHYLQVFPNSEKEEILEGFLETYFDKLTSEIGLFTYCGGLTGALEGLKYLNRERLLEIDYSDVEKNYRELLQTFAINSILNGNYDYLHGGLGIVKYYCDDAEFVNRALEALEQTAEKGDRIYKWKSSLGLDRGVGYNICLSHGMSSIVSVLSLLESEGIDRERRDRIIRNTCNYILSQEIDHVKYGAFFPNQSLENNPGDDNYYSRLAWCYGDLGVATSLWQAGKALHNREWQEKALEVLRFSTSRRDIRSAGVIDAGLCHGAASVCMMFHYAYRQTGENLFEEVRDYWFDVTLNMGSRKEGLAGYSAWGENEKGWVKEYDLLEGIAGIGLLLLSLYIPAPQNTKWMNFFLL